MAIKFSPPCDAGMSGAFLNCSEGIVVNIKKWCLVYLAFFCLLAVLIADTAEAEEPVAVGDTLSPFMLQLYDYPGKYIALRDYCGIPRPTKPKEPRKIVVVSFFSKTCIPCKKEIPQLERLSKLWGNNVQVFLISVGDKTADIKEFITKTPTDLTILMDPFKATAVERYGITSIPTSIVVDPDGIVRYTHSGYKEGDEVFLDEAVRKLINR